MNRSALVLTWIVWLCACSGGGGGGGGDTGLSIIDRSGRNIGTISGFGSVFVNGVEFETQSATITIDDAPGMESDLLVGQIVVIEGLVDANGTTGSADAISADPSIRGVVESIDSVANTITLLGNVVRITASTLFGSQIVPADSSGLAIGDRLEIYGFLDANGEITATLIQTTLDSEFELRGRVFNLNQSVSTFQIDDLVVDFSSANLVGFSSDIANGDLVEAEGSNLDPTGVLLAERVELEAATTFTAADDGTEIELEGVVTRFNNASDFDVAGVSVVTNAATQYESGSSSDLQLNSRVEVEGEIDAQGRLLADEVEFVIESNLEAEAPVEAVDTNGQTITLLGLVLSTTKQTQFIDESDAELRDFSLSDVSVGDFIKAKAFTDASGLTANLIKRKSPEDAVKLSGAVTRIEEPNVFISTAQVATSASSSFEINEQDVTSAEFFAALTVGDRLETEGQSSTPGVLDALAVEIDD